MTVNLYQVDAFTDTPFSGNPAAVCILPKPADDAWMQRVAAEMNLSETAFVYPDQDPFSRAYRLRWFTPRVEVALCGHATLAAAFVLWREGHVRPTAPIHFETASGRLTATAGRPGWITLDFPARPAEPAEPPANLLAGLDIEAADIIFTGRSVDDYLVEVKSPEIVRTLTPNMAALATIDTRGIIVTSQGGDPYHFISRFFGPAAGVMEDPVTGSAHCTLGPYWGSKLNMTELFAYQASARGGSLQIELAGERVKLHGQAVLIFTANLLAGSEHITVPAGPKREEPRFTRHDDED